MESCSYATKSDFLLSARMNTIKSSRRRPGPNDLRPERLTSGSWPSLGRQFKMKANDTQRIVTLVLSERPPCPAKTSPALPPLGERMRAPAGRRNRRCAGGAERSKAGEGEGSAPAGRRPAVRSTISAPVHHGRRVASARRRQRARCCRRDRPRGRRAAPSARRSPCRHCRSRRHRRGGHARRF